MKKGLLHVDYVLQFIKRTLQFKTCVQQTLVHLISFKRLLHIQACCDCNIVITGDCNNPCVGHVDRVTRETGEKLVRWSMFKAWESSRSRINSFPVFLEHTSNLATHNQVITGSQSGSPARMPHHANDAFPYHNFQPMAFSHPGYSYPLKLYTPQIKHMHSNPPEIKA